MSEVSGAVTTGADAPIVEPIEVNGGESAVTFDDLERVESQAKAAKRAEKDTVKDAVKETVKAMDKSKKDDSDKDGKKDSAKETDSEEEDDSEEAGKKEAKSKVEKPAEKEKKSLKGKLGNKEIDLDPDTVLSVKVNGKDEAVSLRDLQRNYGGKVEWEKRFTEIDKERKVFNSKVEGASQKIKAIFEETDPEMRLFKMAEFAGKDPVEVRSKFLADNMELLEKYYSMTEDERIADARDFENRILKQKLEFKEKDEARRNTQAALQTKIQNLGTTHQIPEESFWSRFDELQALKTQGTLSQKITPEFVVETIQKERLWESANEILENAQVEMNADQRSHALIELVDISYSQGLSSKEVKEIAEEMWGKSARTSVVESKLEEQEELRTGRKGTKKAEYSGDNEALFFSDL